MRQSSDIHERVLAELFAKAGVQADYAALDEDAKVKLLLSELAQPRLLFAVHQLLGRDRVELGVLRAAREIRARYGARAIRNYIISHTETVSDLLEVLLLQKKLGLLRIAEKLDLMVIPLFETIPDLQRAPASWKP
jgi:phosphoenolpyruvate carboxylase